MFCRNSFVVSADLFYSNVFRDGQHLGQIAAGAVGFVRVAAESIVLKADLEAPFEDVGMGEHLVAIFV